MRPRTRLWIALGASLLVWWPVLAATNTTPATPWVVRTNTPSTTPEELWTPGGAPPATQAGLSWGYYSNLPRPEWYGGTADGAIDAEGNVTGTDNRDAIQDCLDKHGACYLGDGIYAISYYVSTTNATAALVGRGMDKTTIALLNNTNLVHSTMYGWGTYHPDAIFVGSGSTGVLVEGITFDLNGDHRRVGDKAGYHQPGSAALSLIGHGQVVRNCRFKRFNAFSGSTGGARTPGLPEAFMIYLAMDPTAYGRPELADWAYVDGAKVTGCEFLGPIPAQTDPDDFADVATPELTVVCIAGQGSGWEYGTASGTAGATNITTSAFSTAWMEDHVATFGDPWGAYERVKIAAVLNATNIVIETPITNSWTNAVFRVLKRTRTLMRNPEVSGCTFKDLKIYRVSDSNKFLRAIHLITPADTAGGIVVDNQVMECDAAFLYLDAWICHDLMVRNNRIQNGLYGIGLGFGSYALSAKAGSGWWRNIFILQNQFQHGGGAMARMYYLYADKIGSNYRMSTRMGSFANGCTIDSQYSDQEWEDYHQPATATVREQTRCVENLFVTGNNFQVVDDYYSFVWYQSVWNSVSSLSYANLTDNIFDSWIWVEENAQLQQQVNEGVLGVYQYGPQYRVGYNQRSTGELLPVYSQTGTTEVWPALYSTPNGFTRDVVTRLDWNTVGAAFGTVAPTNGYTYYASTEYGNASINQRYADIEWVGAAEPDLNLVFPTPEDSGFGVSPNSVRPGTRLSFLNHGAEAVDLYWNKAGTPTLIKSGVSTNELVLMTVDSDGYRWESITPASTGKSD